MGDVLLTENGHLSSDALDEYVLQRLQGTASIQVGEHLRRCESCRAAAADLQAFVEALRYAEQ